MWRVIRSFERSFIINNLKLPNKNIYSDVYFNNIKQRFLATSVVKRYAETVLAAQHYRKDDAAYIVPYKFELEKLDHVKTLMETLHSKFLLSQEEVERIATDDVVLKSYRVKSWRNTLDILIAEGITKENVVEYPWLITLDNKKLLEKIQLLKSLNGFQDINEFVPFLRVQNSRLRKLVFVLNRESDYIDHGNRIYFIAKKLNLSPHIVSKYLSKRLFVLEMPAEMFKSNLEHMIKYNIEPMNLLKDLWGFRYDPRAVERRLQRASQAKKEKIMPWMVRCPETILQKSLQISLDELKILGNKTSVAEYVAERLGFSTEEAQVIMNIHPKVNSVRVTKIKEVFDYLLDEAKFTRHEIAQVPRILCHSLDTTKQRIEELKKYGCRPTTLVIVCRSKREYEKFLKQWQINSKTCEEITKDEKKD